MPRIARLAAVIVLSLSACAPARTDVASAAAPAAAARGPGGVIVTIRPMTAASDAILVALNEGGAARTGRSGAAMEFIIREDGGRTISVVQTDADSFKAGERVALTGGARMRITRLSG